MCARCENTLPDNIRTQITIGVVGVQSGTADTITDRGPTKSLVLKLIGPKMGVIGLTAVEVVIEEKDIIAVLAGIASDARELFPEVFAEAERRSTLAEEVMAVFGAAVGTNAKGIGPKGSMPFGRAVFGG